MPEVIIRGIPINFPFEPYNVQIAYMEKVISCLEAGGNGVLESPTGTGKTLSLLCASCAWLTHRKAQMQAQLLSKVSDIGCSETLKELNSTLAGNNGDKLEGMGLAQNQLSLLFRAPKIIYASRTHSQLTQAVQELKRTSYKYMKVSVLGSRDQMCIHPEVSKEESNAMKTVLCRVKTKSKTCHFHNNVDKKKEEVLGIQDIIDIEDLVKLGRKLQYCPYYMSREFNTAADITFMPYNYLLDPKTRKNLGLELANSVIILDEAHNIEKVCEESVSHSLSNTDIAMCIEEISQVMKNLVERQESGFSLIDDESQPPDFTADDLTLLKILFLELEKAVDDLPPGSTYPGNFMFELLQKADLTPGKRNLVIEALNKIVTYLSTTGSSPFQRKGSALQKFTDLMSLVFRYEQDCPSYTEQLKISYKVHVSMDEDNKKKANSWSVSRAPQGKIVNFWCFSPQFGIGHLVAEDIHCLILTSGTLSPLESFISELGIKVRETLENPHIVGDKQVRVAILKKGPDGCELNSSFNTRNNPNYLSSLGRTLVNLSYVIPDGVLVFFPSYGFMKICQESWQLSGVWSQIEKNKPIFVEPRTKNELSEIMDGYYSKIQDPATRGACFMAVTRGKVSEGLDFADFNGRAVVITGLPYPPFKDPRVELKKKYLNEIQQSGKKTISGMQWYMLEATKAVNQAVGRVIRHSTDYGLILLCDARFDSPSITGQLSSWLRTRIKRYTEFGPLVKTIREFFRTAEKELPAPKGKPPPSSSISFPSFSGPGTFDVVTSGQKRTYSQTKDNDTSMSWSREDYLKPDDKNETAESTIGSSEQSSVGVLGALEKPTTIIDFNETFVPSPSTTKSSSSAISSSEQQQQQQQKKRKLKIVPLKFFNPDSQSSCASTSGLSETSAKPKESLESITDYVKQVRNKLGNDACSKLKIACSDYKKNGNLKDLHLALKAIFHSESSHSLLKGYERFVKREHREQFRELIALDEILGAT
ncbi:Regulator of telomere elongation helicase 1 homolog [Gryllus bimaculatus]|nr:Regulator of telomere elongation helicase 1 homolog [Gryllus bimaculatus]